MSNEQIFEWYRRAMMDNINIFDDQNAVIAMLARAILEERGVDVETFIID